MAQSNANLPRKFQLGAPEETYRCPIFRVESREATSHDGIHRQPMYTIKCSHWVNVIPVTADGHVALIEQHRFGTDTITLETPGGAVDPGENDLTMAALRELEEETGLKLDPKHFHYVGLFDKPWRDPRNKNCVSYAFRVILDDYPEVVAGDDATECTWNDVDSNGDVSVQMAFDHAEIIKKSLQR